LFGVRRAVPGAVVGGEVLHPGVPSTDIPPSEDVVTTLFDLSEFVGNSGNVLPWRVECDALTDADWEALAFMAVSLLPPFHTVEGVPRGGLPFADALREHCTTDGKTLLIADDVCTTGGSLTRHRANRPSWCVVAFARGPLPPLTAAVWKLGTYLRETS
jgi:hypothetical protein